MDLRRPDLLDLGKHNRSTFDCGNAEMNQWLAQYSGQNRRGNTAATWVIADLADNIACFATLAMTAIDKSAAPKKLGRNAPASIPALLIGRLATDRSYAGMGVGSAMVHHVLLTAVDINQRVACRAVVVHALDPTAFDWWQRFGFLPFGEDDLALYLLTDDILATFHR
ncbi:MAG: GNAT family N-acetyltransferase [Sporichthyaceae bacterium]